MKAVVFHGVGGIRLDDLHEPKIEQPTDAISAYEAFDKKAGWVKVELKPGA